MHWTANVENHGKPEEALSRSAPTRRIENRTTLAYLVPLMAETGQIPKSEVWRVASNILNRSGEVSVERLLMFDYGKSPYSFRVIDCDLTGHTVPYAKVRYGGWVCKEHRGSVTADVPTAILERDRYRCVVCGRSEMVSVEYMTPLDEKGKLSVANAATFCMDCSAERGDTPYWDFLRAKGIPLTELVIDWSTNFVRSATHGDRFML